MGCTAVNNSDPATTKRRAHTLALTQTVSLEGSEWDRPVVDPLTLEQDFSDFFAEDDENELNLMQSAEGQVDRPGVAASNLTLAQILAFAGCLCGESGEGLTPVSAIFDSTTQSGMAIYVSSNGHVDLAQADDVITSVAVGLAKEVVLAAETGNYLTEGQIERDDWTNVVGTEFLTPGAVYYLSTDDPGQLTIIAPIIIGQFVVVMGKALTTTMFDIEIAQSVLL